MPFAEGRKMSPKKEFVILAGQAGSNVSELCRRYSVSRPTGYKWLKRFVLEGEEGLEERSSRPHRSPERTDGAIEEMILEARDTHPAWGGRKIKRHLENMGASGVPSATTITGVLRRNGRLDAEGVAKPWKRFERDEPMDLLQMDFKGHFAVDGGRCHPLTVLDDHSRYLLGLEACADERGATVKGRLTGMFRRYGLPRSIITDNGAPWAAPASPGSFTELGVWLIRLGIELKRAGEYHPQTMGKVERLHRTLKAEVLQGRNFRHIADCQEAFDDWRDDYNFRRPHQAIGMATPSSRFRVSDRTFLEAPPEIEYGPDDEVRKVQDGGYIHFRGAVYRVGRAFKGLPVAVRMVGDGLFDAYCVRQKLLHINMRDAP